MWKLTWRDLLAHKFRFILTTLAVMAGVTFVVSTFVIRAGLGNTFDDLFAEINQNIDIEVRGALEFEESDFADSSVPIPEASLAIVDGVDGVAETSVGVGGTGPVPFSPDGEPLETIGPPVLGFSWSGSNLDPTRLVDGDPPGPGQFVIDEDTFDDEGYVLGETYRVSTDEGVEEFQLSGVIRFGDDNQLIGAKLAQYELADAQRLFDRVGQYDYINVRIDDGANVATVVSAINAALPEGIEAVDQQAVIDEDVSDVNQFIDIIGNALLGFAMISLFVAAFLIFNIFNITIGQRTRELGLLRAIGANAGQVRWSVVLQALVVGVLASALGIGLGVLFAIGFGALLNAAGFGLPQFSPVVSPGTIIAAFAFGIPITLVAALVPALKAARVSPITAMRSGLGSDERKVISFVIGGVMTVGGALLLFLGLFGGGGTAAVLSLLGLGAVLIFLGVTLLSPLFAGPISRLIGHPLALVLIGVLGVAVGIATLPAGLVLLPLGLGLIYGGLSMWPLPGAPWPIGSRAPSGRLARENSARNTQKTAATVGALMIGLALISTAAVFGQSLKQTFRETLSSSVQADFYITPDQNGPDGSFSPELARRLAEAPEISQATGYRFGRIRVEGEEKDTSAADLTAIDGLLDPDVVRGTLDDAGPGTILVHEDPADDLGVGPGDTLTVEFATGGSEELTVAAVYADSVIFGNWVIDLTTWDEHFTFVDDVFAAAKTADGVDPAAARAAVDGIASQFASVEVEDRSEFQASQEGQVDGFIRIINLLLGLAVVIAVLGIAISMTLAVFERTQEIGLLRAVGMRRAQARTMVRWESVIVSIFAALLGVAIGIFFGFAIVTAVPDTVISTFAIPWTTLMVYVLVAALAGLLAGLYPSWRAGRMNVLEAISHP